jgi:hypothetical protein
LSVRFIVIKEMSTMFKQLFRSSLPESAVVPAPQPVPQAPKKRVTRASAPRTRRSIVSAKSSATAVPMPVAKPERPSPPPMSPAGPSGGGGFVVRTAIARAVGSLSRYCSDAVRALPVPRERIGRAGVGDVEGEVILEATDGKQATVLIVEGDLASPAIVPTQVLPTRQLTKPVHVHCVHGQWQSTEGKVAPRRTDEDASFPPIGDVLPAMAGPVVTLAVDISLLKKIADSLGTMKLALLIPLGSYRAGESYAVNRAIGVTGADQSGVKGVAAIMPVNSAPGIVEHFEAVRQQVRKAESAKTQAASSLQRSA